MAKEVKQWITIKGRHIPIYEGESKADAIKRLKEGAKKGIEHQKKAHSENVSKKKSEWYKKNSEAQKAADKWEKDETPQNKSKMKEADKEERKAAKEWHEAEKGKVKAHFKKKESSAGNKESLAKKPQGNSAPAKKAVAVKENEQQAAIRQKVKSMSIKEKEDYIKANKLDKEWKKQSGMIPSGHMELRDMWRDSLISNHMIKNQKKQSDVPEPASKGNDAISRTASRLQKKGYNDPESIEKHLRELSPVRRNRLAQELGVTGRGDEKIKAMTQKIHEAQGGKKTEPAPAKKNSMGISDIRGDKRGRELIDRIEEAEEEMRGRGLTDNDNDIWVSQKKQAVEDLKKEFGYEWDKPAKTWQDKDAEVKAKQIANAEKQKAERNAVRHYGSEIEDEQFRKDALAEMRRYKSNWDFYSAKERQNIAPNGVKELDARIKEIEDYEKNLKKAPAKFNAKESMNSINELSKKRNNGGKTEDDWKSVRDTLDKAPAGTVMISNGERGSQSHYKKLKDGSWESMSGYNKGEIKTSKLISMGWEGHTGSSPQVEFTTEKKMAAAKAKAQASVDKAFKKAADIPGIKSNKSTLTRSGSSIYLDLDRADITEANIKALTKKGWIRRGHMDDTWIYSAKSRK